MIRGEARRKCDAQQTRIVPALALVVNVQDEFFLSHTRENFQMSRLAPPVPKRTAGPNPGQMPGRPNW